MKLRQRSVILLVLLLTIPPSIRGTAAAQGVQTGEMRGVVTDASGAVVPGVTVVVTSAVLQGARSVTTDARGGYNFRGLPPGTYATSFSLLGFSSVERSVEVPLGSVADVDVALTAAPIAEEVLVVGQADSVVRQTQVSTTITKDTLDLLPLGRTPYAIAAVMPGLTTNTPNGGQLSISGSFGYDNVFLVDGTDVNDNLFGTADALFIEDAIAETQVLTGGISAEYGRFSGGVVNVVSRSGGNVFSGGFRESWSNPSWEGRSPFEKMSGTSRTDKLNKVHEATFGGPIVRDRVWFFSAGLFQRTSDDSTFPQTGIPYVFRNENTRGQVKLTATVARQHVVSGQYLANQSNVVAPAFGFTIDPAALMRPEYPLRQVVATYRGTPVSNLFAELQFSTKQSGFRKAGGDSTDIFDSPIINSNPLGAYNAPYFDATDPEDRDNRQVTGSLSYFVSGWGRHDLKIGAELFQTTNRGGNSQTATGYVFGAEYLTDSQGRPALDASGRLTPVFVPGETTIENWLPVRGAKIDIKTTSLYLQDRWSMNRRWSGVVGTRFEVVRSNATGGIVGVDTRTIVPRLGLAFDPAGDGRLVISSTYGHYAGKYGEAQFAGNTNVGNPDALLGVYVGPEGQGRSFAPGFTPGNYVFVDGSFPTANVFFDEGLSSPVTKEFTLQAGRTIGRRAYAKVVYSNRHVTNFVEDFVTLDTGTTTVSKGGVTDVFSNIVYRNSDLPQRRYQAVEMFGSYRPIPRWMVNGAWTVQLKNEGNFEGESANRPGISSPIGEYPEAFNEQRHYPVGRLASFQRHSVDVWSVYGLGLGRLGRVDVSGRFAFDSALTYSFRAAGQPLSALQRDRITGYVSQPTGQTIYFGPRGAGRFEDYGRFSMAATYSVPVLRRARPWLKLELYNVLNNGKLVTWNTTVRADPDSPLDESGLPTGYLKSPLFGQAQSNGNYLAPRTFQMAFGVRF
ncbi:MAG: TonB-dependent receptor [Acidobacteria bacterium]|nr:TonB-dependent receptor [Acidobacteriota bacterium]